MAKTEELEKIKKAFTPEVSIIAFKDVGQSIVAYEDALKLASKQ